MKASLGAGSTQFPMRPDAGNALDPDAHRPAGLQPVEMSQQAFGVHSSGGPSSASSACTVRRRSGKFFAA